MAVRAYLDDTSRSFPGRLRSRDRHAAITRYAPDALSRTKSLYAADLRLVAAWDTVAVSTADKYRWFASAEARGESPCYQERPAGVAADRDLTALIDELPEPKRQPNLVFATARYIGIAPGGFATFRAELLTSWPEVREIVLPRRTQTNEQARSAVMMPLLAALPQPLALLEVGASAGLCLYPDKFSYQYGNLARIDPPTGPGAALLSCAIDGPVPVPVPVAPPKVVWRAGIDLNPLDVADAQDMRWLETLIWPEQDDRWQRLAAAIGAARSDPPYLMTGDLNDTVENLAGQAPADATVVVFHSSVLFYLDPPGPRGVHRDGPGPTRLLALQRGTVRRPVRRRGTPAITRSGQNPGCPGPGRPALRLRLPTRPVSALVRVKRCRLNLN
jgi:hypothetical protein